MNETTLKEHLTKIAKEAAEKRRKDGTLEAHMEKMNAKNPKKNKALRKRKKLTNVSSVLE